MVTHCFSDPRWELAEVEPLFVHGTIELLTIIIPAAIVVVIWKLYVTNKRISRPRFSTLGLDDSLEEGNRAHSCAFRVSSRVNLLIYGTTALVTFDLGCFVQVLRESLR